MDKIIFHIDVNNAFLSWEAADRVKRRNIKEDLRDTISVIGGDESKRRGVVLAKFQSAKELGIKTGQSLYQARKIYPKLKVVRPNFKIYRYYSNEMFKILSEYTDEIERYSIDECFLDYTSSKRLFGDEIKTAKEINRRIREELGFTVNVGVSENKLLAKMATELRKPDKVNTLFRNEIKEKIYHLSVRELFMVGKNTEQKLNRLNIKTIGDLAGKDLYFLQKHFKNSMGEMLYNYSHGIDHSKVEREKDVKSIGNSMTLKEDTNNIEEIYSFLFKLCESVGMRLKKRGVKGDTVVVTIKNFSFYVYSHQKKLNYYTNSTNEIFEEVKKIFLEFWRGEKIRLLGVSVNNVTKNPITQMSFFDEKKNDNTNDLDDIINDIQTQFGADKVKRGSNLKDNKLMEKIDYFDKK